VTFTFPGTPCGGANAPGGVDQGAVGAAGIEITPGRPEPTPDDAAAPVGETMAPGIGETTVPPIDGGSRKSRGFNVSIM